MTMMSKTAPVLSQPDPPADKSERVSRIGRKPSALDALGYPGRKARGGPEEFALIRAAVQGDLEAFNQLALVYQDQIFQQAYRILGDAQAADDAAQDAFISAYRNLPSYRGGSFRAWLSRIVTNLCYDELRRRRARPTIPFELHDLQGDEIESPEWATDQEEMPEEQLLRVELGRAIQQSLNHLPPGHRTVLVLVDMLGYEYTEAAEVLGRPVGTVKSRLARARTQMRTLLLAAGKL